MESVKMRYYTLTKAIGQRIINLYDELKRMNETPQLYESEIREAEEEITELERFEQEFGCKTYPAELVEIRV